MPFDPFGDFATCGYLRNFAGEKDAEAVKHLEHRAFAAHVLDATVHTDMARRAGFHIAWHEIAKKPFLEALTAQLRQPGSALDALVAPYIRGGPPDLSTTAAQLAANQGINPVSARAGARPGPA